MLEFQVLDVDYVSLNDRPILRVFGKTVKGETVCGFYENFQPYFYVSGGDAEAVFKDNPEVQGVQKVKRFVIGSQKVKDMYKVLVINPAKTPELRAVAENAGLKAYEADILFKYRFMNDLKISGLGWVKVDGGNGVSTATVKTNKKVKIEKIEPVEKEGDAPLKYLAFDIECIPAESGNMPEATKDPVIMISLVFSEEYKGKKDTVLCIKPHKDAESFTSEKEMLEEFIKIVNEFDPDMMTGYNVNGFDFPYILERMRKNNIRPCFGRCGQKQVMNRKVGMNSRTNITGRVVVDSFELVKKDFSLQRYSLDAVSKALLGEGKESVKHSEIEKLWKGSNEDVALLIKYCRKDSILAMDLVKKLNLTDKYSGLSKVAGTLMQDSLDSGETTRIENYMLREFNMAGYVMPCRPNERETLKRSARKKTDLGGGAVLEPVKGLHPSVLVLDFKSMYPTIVISFNICPTTLVKEGENTIITPSGARFLTKEEKVGIVPKLVETLLTARGEVKKKMKQAKGEKHRQLYAKQWALKIMANAIYGYFGYIRSRLYSLDIANAITSTGRDSIYKTKEAVEKKYGYEIVYGDTDSVFVKVPETDMDKIEAIGTEVAGYITSQLMGNMELEFEKVFKRFLPLTKKRYAAWSFTKESDGWKDKIETKGIETVRRDWCGLVGETLSSILETLLKKDDVKGALAHFREVVIKLNKGEVDMEKLIITKMMTKKPEKYAGIQPHIELAKKLAARDATEAPGVGDRIGYVIIKGTDLLSKRTEDPEYVKEKGLQIDSSYYIDNQLLPPVERLFSGLGITKSELLGNGKQMGILDILRDAAKNGAAPQPAQGSVQPSVGSGVQASMEAPAAKPEPVTIDKVLGMVCSKCSKHYSRIPLVGMCHCGGEVNFSTQNGPASEVMVS